MGGCHKVVCPDCKVSIKQCQTIGGKCPSCYQKSKEPIKVNAANTAQINGEHIKQQWVQWCTGGYRQDYSQYCIDSIQEPHLRVPELYWL